MYVIAVDCASSYFTCLTAQFDNWQRRRRHFCNGKLQMRWDNDDEDDLQFADYSSLSSVWLQFIYFTIQYDHLWSLTLLLNALSVSISIQSLHSANQNPIAFESDSFLPTMINKRSANDSYACNFTTPTANSPRGQSLSLSMRSLSLSAFPLHFSNFEMHSKCLTLILTISLQLSLSPPLSLSLCQSVYHFPFRLCFASSADWQICALWLLRGGAQDRLEL